MSDAFATIGNRRVMTLAGMRKAAGHALKCAYVIRKWLPVEGQPPGASQATMDWWHDNACRDCFEFFQLIDDQGSYGYSAPRELVLCIFELHFAMVEVRNLYGWEEVDYDHRLPHSDVRGGKLLPEIPRSLLERIAKAGREILEYKPNMPDDPIGSVLSQFETVWKKRKSHRDAGEQMAKLIDADLYTAYCSAKAKKGRPVSKPMADHFAELSKTWAKSGVLKKPK